MAGKMGKFDYVSDDTNTYIVREDASNAAAQSSHTPATGRPNLPHGYIGRKIEVVDSTDTTGGRTPTGLRRSVIINDAGDALYVGGTTTITLPDFTVTPSVAVVWNVSAIIGERRLSR
jgi:hypothetical protein